MTQIKAARAPALQSESMFPRTPYSLFVHAASVFAILAALSVNSVNAIELPDWKLALSDEIWFEHACQVAFFSHVVERETEAGRVLLVKVHCEDQRSFDVSQSGPDAPFMFSECTPREKNAC